MSQNTETSEEKSKIYLAKKDGSDLESQSDKTPKLESAEKSETKNKDPNTTTCCGGCGGA